MMSRCRECGQVSLDVEGAINCATSHQAQRLIERRYPTGRLIGGSTPSRASPNPSQKT